VLSLTWLVPSVGKRPPEIMEKSQRRISLVQPQAPRPTQAFKAESVPRPEPIHHVSFDDETSTIPSAAPHSAPSSARVRSIPLPRCKSRTVHSGAISLPSAVTSENSPLSSAETLTEAPTEMKRAFSARLTRALPWGRSSTTPTLPSSDAVVSEFGEHVVGVEKGESRPNVTQRGRFRFLKKSRTIDVRIRSGMMVLFGLCAFNLTCLSQLSVRVEIPVDPLP
jgi:hypothetical protein